MLEVQEAIKMNICFVNPTRQIQSGLGGLVKSLADRGHNVIVLTPFIPREDELNALGAAHVKVFPSIFIPKIRYTLPFFFSQLRILRKVVVKEKIDLIYVYKYAYLTAWVPLLYAKICGMPVVLITDSILGISWKYGSELVDFIAKIYAGSIGRLILKLCDKVVVLSPALLKPCLSMGVEERNLLAIPKGVDFDHFELNEQPTNVRESLGISQDEMVILNVGRLVPVKGIDTLIKITEKLLDDGFKVRTVIVGDGPYRAEYEALANELGDRVIFTGFRTDISELLSACDIFVLPSLSEGVPSALLEAAICGKTMVASNVGGIPDIIIQEKTGFLAEPEDVDSFVYYIKLLLNDKELALKLGKNAHKHVRSNFDWGEIAERHEEVCRQVMQNRGRAVVL